MDSQNRYKLIYEFTNSYDKMIETLDKYRSRYGNEWRSKLLEVTKKMMDKIEILAKERIKLKELFYSQM